MGIGKYEFVSHSNWDLMGVGDLGDVVEGEERIVLEGLHFEVYAESLIEGYFDSKSLRGKD